MNYLAQQIGHIVIGTPKIQPIVEEALDVLGLQIAYQDENQASLTSNSRQRELSYIKSDSTGVISIGLESVSLAAWEEARDRCNSLNTEIKESQVNQSADVKSFIVKGPSGLPFELHTPHPRNQFGDYSTNGIKPKRLDHVNLTVPDPIEEFKFLRSVFGLGLSDRSDGDEILFLHAADGYHHSVALVKGDAGLHHVSFETHHVHDLIRLADKLAEDGRTLLWGPGHHGANAQSYFTYHLDRIGCMIEYSFGMQTLELAQNGYPGTWPMEPTPGQEWLNTWGAPPPGMYGDPRLPACA